MSGHETSETVGKIRFWLMFIGVNTLFFPQHSLGLSGLPRRYVDYRDAFPGWNPVSSIWTYISALSFFVFLFGVVQAFVRKSAAACDPWGEGATTVDWQLSSPPPFHQFERLPRID